MKLQTVPARQGALWVRQGFKAFARHPVAFCGLFIPVLAGMVLVNIVPMLVLFALPLVPLVSLGFMIASRTVIDGGKPTWSVFTAPLRAPRPRVVALIQLGLIYAGALLLIMMLGEWIDDGGASEALVQSPAGPASAASAPPAMAPDPGALFELLLRLTLTGLLAIPFWHAPALVHWDGHGCAKALFSSTIAVWRNRGAFAMHSLIWFAWIMGLGMLGGLLLSVLGQPQLLLTITLPISAVVAVVYYASLYFTFADCFVATDGDAAGGALPPPSETTSS
ncbi:MAG: BPSS1780 family membrane protein [Pseudomonadota bacterium]